MKRADSRFIERFLSCVRVGAITGHDSPVAPAILQEMVVAMQSIIEGVEPDTALKITRTAGTPPDPVIFTLGWLIHTWRGSGDKWSVVEVKAAEWLASQGRKKLSATRLKRILQDNEPVILQKKSVVQMIALMNEDSQKK